QSTARRHPTVIHHAPSTPTNMANSNRLNSVPTLRNGRLAVSGTDCADPVCGVSHATHPERRDNDRIRPAISHLTTRTCTRPWHLLSSKRQSVHSHVVSLLLNGYL